MSQCNSMHAFISLCCSLFFFDLSICQAIKRPQLTPRPPHLPLLPGSCYLQTYDSYICVGQCSQYGICLAGSLTTPNAAPTITLVTTAAAPQTTSIKLGYSYQACASGQQPYTGAECELGATASDSQNGNLTLQVLVCAPTACTTAACVARKCTLTGCAVSEYCNCLANGDLSQKVAYLNKQRATSLYTFVSVI